MTAPERISKDRTKVVLRHVPPGFDGDSLLNLLKGALNPFPEYDYYNYAPPDYSLAPFLTCRVYFNFTNPESAVRFKERFDGQKFIDLNKVQSVGIVEYAPFQRVPKRVKKDVRSNTIEKDADYLAFLEELKIEPEAPPSIETIIEEIEKRRAAKSERESSTALLEFIKSRKVERSLSPHSKPAYNPRRHPKTEDRRFRSNSRRARGTSEGDHHDQGGEHHHQEENAAPPPPSHNKKYRSRNNVKVERDQSKSGSGGGSGVGPPKIPEKQIYIAGGGGGNKRRGGGGGDCGGDPRVIMGRDEKEERHSYRREGFSEDKKEDSAPQPPPPTSQQQPKYNRREDPPRSRDQYHYRRDQDQGVQPKSGYRRAPEDGDHYRGYRGGGRGGGAGGSSYNRSTDDRRTGRGGSRGRGSRRGSSTSHN